MIEPINIKVRTPSLDYMYLEWGFSPTTEEVHDYHIYVLRSEGVGGPWTTVAGPLEDRYRFVDGSVNLRDRYRKYYYKIKLVKKSDSSTTESKAVTTTFMPTLEALEIQRLERIYFNEYVGRKVLLFPVKTTGQRCPCYDPITGAKDKSNCFECWDTSFVGGYLRPVQIHMQIDPNPRATQIAPDFETQQSNTVARTTDFPYIKPRDLIVEPLENRRWQVSQVIPTERLRVTIHQELHLSEYDPSDVEYNIPINIDLFAFEPNSTYHYTNATCPEHVEGGTVKNASF